MTTHERINQLCELINQQPKLKLSALYLLQEFRREGYHISATAHPLGIKQRLIEDAREQLAAALCELLAPLGLDHGQELPHVVPPQ